MDEIESIEYMMNDMRKLDLKMYLTFREVLGNSQSHFGEGVWISRTVAVAISSSYEVRYNKKSETF